MKMTGGLFFPWMSLHKLRMLQFLCIVYSSKIFNYILKCCTDNTDFGNLVTHYYSFFYYNFLHEQSVLG